MCEWVRGCCLCVRVCCCVFECVSVDVVCERGCCVRVCVRV